MGELLKLVQELREAVEGKRVPCSVCDATGKIADSDDGLVRTACSQPCPCCQGTGQVPDPAFAGLLEVVRVKCPSLGKPHWHRGVHFRAAVLCPTDVWMTRSYESLPEGSLAGALRYWVTQHITEQAKQSGLPTTLYGDRMTDPQYIEWWVELRENLDQCFSTPHPDEAACGVVLEALALQPKG